MEQERAFQIMIIHFTKTLSRRENEQLFQPSLFPDDGWLEVNV